MSFKVRDEITCPFPNSNGATVEVWEWVNYFISIFITDVITYTCGIKLIEVSKGAASLSVLH